VAYTQKRYFSLLRSHADSLLNRNRAEGHSAVFCLVLCEENRLVMNIPNIHRSNVTCVLKLSPPVAYQEFCSEGGGFQQIQLRTEGRVNGDLGAVAP
jgi:hypothetical protein